MCEPAYYHCLRCKESFEADEPITAPTFCPNCPKGGMRGVLQSGMFPGTAIIRADPDTKDQHIAALERWQREAVPYLEFAAKKINQGAGGCVDRATPIKRLLAEAGS